jgi:hypothetical protein
MKFTQLSFDQLVMDFHYIRIVDQLYFPLACTWTISSVIALERLVVHRNPFVIGNI